MGQRESWYLHLEADHVEERFVTLLAIRRVLDAALQWLRAFQNVTYVHFGGSDQEPLMILVPMRYSAVQGF